MSQEAEVQSLINAVGDAVVVSDAAGAITVWNPAAERMFGYSEREALGHSLDLITPERFRKRHWDGYHESMRTGHTRYGSDVLRVPATHKDGRALSIAFTIGMLRDESGKVSAVAAIIRDETKRWAEERDLRRRVAELEATVVRSPTDPASSPRNARDARCVSGSITHP